MKISYNWLKQYLDFDLTPEETDEKLTLLGLEVEETETFGSDFEHFVVGEVKEVRAHPNADKLVLCDVDLGSETVQIACGAPNVAAHQKVPVAKVGATIPVPMKDGSYLTIKKAKLRGETSNGMICSESELGLSDDHSGIMVMDDSIETGTPLKTALDVEKDTVFEVALTPNRPDASCHIGAARDLSAVTGGELKNPYSDIQEKKSGENDEISISIEDEEKCHRYVGIVVDNVKVEESPNWLKNRLTAIGLRPINNIVDVTNFINHEISQPLHAFDYDLIGDKKIVVKSYDEEKKFITLDSVERTVPAGSLFICDGNGPVAIAGVMGGENSEVTEGTTKILIESAYFNPSSIRKTSKSLALQTDSSYRFERGIDPSIQQKAAWRAAELIAELTGGTINQNIVDVHPVKTEPIEVPLRVSRINHLLGTELEKKQVVNTLSKLEIEVSSSDENKLICIIPTFRPDITREVDLIEEVGRVYDYNNILRPDSSPFISPQPLSDREEFQERIRDLVKSLRYKEISTNSLLSKKEADLLADEDLQIHSLNPVSQENTTLRTHLSGGFLKAIQYNLNRNATQLRFFEIGHIFRNSDEGTWIDGIEEHVHLYMGLCGQSKKDNWQSDENDFSIFDLKADLEAVFDNFGISDSLVSEADGNNTIVYKYANQEVSTLKRINSELLKGFDIESDVYGAEIDLTLLLQHGIGKKQMTYQPIVKFPTFEFDAAFTVDKGIRAGDLAKDIKETAGEILQSVSVFDVYEGENLGADKKSIAFRLTFLDSNKTLNIKDVEPVVQKIVQKLEKTVGAKLRS
ncbi:MAG: phenylalanine--tRNA ligase subunit beta [Bacteroidetes bacterium]|jgi:phenylalanyl-tRNA synthetase beta chain|nr:phenylalanine--tRNA ligase subunit beta [Bacteroidota bacterium]